MATAARFLGSLGVSVAPPPQAMRRRPRLHRPMGHTFVDATLGPMN